MESSPEAERLRVALAGRCAAPVLVEHGFTTLPVDPMAIAKNLEIECRPAEFAGMAGCLLYTSGQFTIVYSDMPGFDRFTVAHELGHYYIPGHVQVLFPHGGGEHRSVSNDAAAPIHEREADEFAANLLMPEDLFRGALAPQSGRGLRAIEALSKECGTSLTATAIRFAKLCDVPVAIVVSSKSRVEYCFMSVSLRERRIRWIKKGDPVPWQSATHEFMQNASNVKDSQRLEASTSLDVWFEDADPIQINEDVLGLGSYGKTLTVLFPSDQPSADLWPAD